MPKPVTAEKKKKVQKTDRKVVYQHPDVFWYYDNKEDKRAKGPLTEALAKKLTGWTEEKEKGEFGDDYTLVDNDGNKVRLVHCIDNRMFFTALANEWAIQILRKEWKFNLETIIIDIYGGVQGGQHRLAGLVLACQLWRRDEHWKDFWGKEPTMESLVAVGGKPEAADTIGIGKSNTLADILFRGSMFQGKSRQTRHKATKIAQYAIRMLWRRTGVDLVAEKAYMPKKAPSEYLDFLKRHPRIEECVSTVIGLDKEKRITRLIPPGSAAGLLYLMGASSSEQNKYDEHNSEQGVDWKSWTKAVKFWKMIAEKDKEVKPLLDSITHIDASGSVGLAEKCAALVKGWNLYLEGKKITKEGVQVLITTNDLDQVVIGECPTCGGIDIGDDRSKA